MSGMQVLPNDGVDMSKVPVISEKMLEDIKNLPGIADAVRYYKANEYNGLVYKNKSDIQLAIIGSNADYLKLNGYQVKAGRNLIKEDFTKIRNVAVLDDAAVDNIFDGDDPVGKVIELKGIPFTVVGVVSKMEGDFEINLTSLSEWETYFGDATSGMMLIPDSSWQEVYAYDQPYQLVVKAKSTEDMTKAGKNAADYLNNLIPVSDQEEKNSKVTYKSEDTLEKAKELQNLSSATSRQLIWIAGISLLVGGIGVMNIMLVSVTERTREIGLKKALGARRKVILSQFLTEAAVLTSLGGLLGVLCGIGLSYFISHLASVPVAISVPAIIVSVAFSMVIGIIFGLIPSIKASKLDPIEALRYE